MTEPTGVSGKKLTGVMLAIVALFVAIGLFLLLGPKLVDTGDVSGGKDVSHAESPAVVPDGGD